MAKASNKSIYIIATAVLLYSALSSCEKEKSKSGQSAPGAAVSNEPTTDPSSQPKPAVSWGGGVSGALIVGDSVPAGAIKNAAILVESHPELNTTADDNGKFKIENVQPGALTIYALSQEANLTGNAASFGAKIAEVVVKNNEQTALAETRLKPTGGIQGIVGFLDTASTLSLAGTDVFIPGTGFLAKTSETGAYAINGLPEGVYSVYAMRDGFATAKLNEVNVIAGAISADTDLLLSISTGPEGAIEIVANLDSIVAGIPIKIANQSIVAINLRFDSDAVLMKLSDEPAFIDRAWLPVSSTANADFSKTDCFDSNSPASTKIDGKKTIYVMYSDTNGLESSPYRAEIFVDTLPPVLSGISILNGWAQTAVSENFVEISAADAGAGISQYRVSYVDSSFSDNLSWQSYSERVNVQLGSTPGIKTVYFQVKDRANRTSMVASDSITKASITEIYATNYSKPMTLYRAHSPYRIGNDTVFDSDLTIEAGVEITIDRTTTQSRLLKVKGVVTALGTDLGLNKILIASDSLTNCGGVFDHSEAPPGVGERSLLRFVEFRRIRDIYFNGGTISQSKISGEGCGAPTGILDKIGQDPLLMDQVQFANWDIGVRVKGGDGATTIRNSTGNVQRLINQKDSGNNSKVFNNTVAGNSTVGYALLTIENGSIDQSGNVFSGTSAIVNYKAGGNFTLSGLTVTGCSQFSDSAGSTGGTLTIRESSIFGCDYAVQNLGALQIVFEKNDIITKKSLVEWIESTAGTVDFVRNDIIIDATGLDWADLVIAYKGAHPTANPNVGFEYNNITCDRAKKCRGGIAVDASAGVSTVTFTLAFTGNHWLSGGPGSGTGGNGVQCSVAGVDCRPAADATGYADPALSRMYEFFGGPGAHGPAFGLKATWNLSGNYGTNAAFNADAGKP